MTYFRVIEKLSCSAQDSFEFQIIHNFEFHKPFSLNVYEDREIFAPALHDTITITGSAGLTLSLLMRHFDNFMPHISKGFISSIQLNR